LRKEKEAAMLKEQRRLEENAKAKEAMERKKRMADRAQARAALREQREAEQKEKVNYTDMTYLVKIFWFAKFFILAVFPISLT